MTMLDRMRRHKGWLKWSLALVVLTFVVFYIPDFLQDQTAAGAAPGEVVADIDGREVTAGQFQRRYQNQLAAYQGAYGGNINASLLRQLGIERQILQQMVDEQAALTEAERLGIRVSDEEVASVIFAMPGLQENGRFIGEQRYEQVLRTQRPPMTKGEFEDNLRKSLIVNKLRAALTDWMSTTDEELEREFRARNEKVKLQVVALTADKFRDKVSVTDDDIAKHYEAHKAEYRIGERRKVKFLLVDMEQARQKAMVPSADVQRFYNDNLQQYQTPEQVRASHILLKTEGKNAADVQKRAEDLLKQVKAGGNFAQLAVQYSEDESAKQGGDLDYFGRGRMVPEFEKAAFAMAPGQISDLVKTQYGFHIIKVVDQKPATTRTLDEVRAQIQDQLSWQRAQETVQTQARGLDEKIESAADFERVAKEAGLPIQESGFFTKEEPIPGIGGAPAVAAEAFRLKDGEVSETLNSPRGPVFIMVSGKEDPRVPALDAVKDKAREDVIRQRATELSRQRAAQIAATLRTAKDFKAAAKAQGLEAKDTELIPRDSPIPDVGVNPEIDKVAFSLPAGAVSEPIVTNNGTVIVRVAERDEVTPQEVTERKGAFREEILNERRGQFFSSYMTKAKKEMKIEVNEDVLRRVVGTP
jgi:peptidyl-prolyl cis-trans isomerase D